jgi:tetratricopeptide (TPR) repeat protein
LGFIAAIVASGFLVGLFLVGPKARRLTYGLMVMSLTVAIAGFAVVRHYAQQRKQSVDFRVFTWIGTWDMIRAQPWLGSGIGSFKWAYPAYRRPEIILLEARSNTETDHAEDEYLEVMFDEGMVGFGLFLWLIVSGSVMGLRLLNRLTGGGPRPPPEIPFDERVYKILAYLGAWWGALIHWFMDVSVRFVSSGIFSFLLPALVVSFVRNDPMPDQQDRPSRADLWIRIGIAVFWMAFFLFPDKTLKPMIAPGGILFMGACLLVLGEVMERQLSPNTPPFSPFPFFLAAALCVVAEFFEIPDLGSEGLTAIHVLRVFSGLGLFFVGWIIQRMGTDTSARLEPLPGGPGPHMTVVVAAAFGLSLWLAGASVWRGYFLGDVSHNVAIFFSKQNIWMRSPEFDERVKVPGYPPEMREEYEQVGGALEHYEKTADLNPGFPMARYFVGNVYNDWGSNVFEASRQARQKGDLKVSETLRDRAIENWNKSLDAYEKVKAFAPNYVQTHHQVGLVYLKMGEMESSMGSKEKAEEYWQKALENFNLYHQLDPVFPPNYYRQSYVHFMQGNMAKAEADYLGALVFNSTNVVGRVYNDRNAETYSNLGRLYYVQLVNENPTTPRLPANSESFLKAEAYYLKALEEAKLSSGREDQIGMEPAKALAVLYSRVGLNDKAQELWLRIRGWNPEDPDVQRVFSPAPASAR